jgi:N-acetyl-anhydromuramyl-L-alanine amidase AmpD
MNIIETNLDFNSNKSRMGNVNGIVLHHTAVSALQSVEVIHNYHKNHNGWAGIGYHYYVRKDGSVYRGRPEEYAGAHCPGVNSSSIGICAEGNFNEETMSDEQKNAIIELIADIKSRYNITYIKGHREIIATSCPGNNYPLDEIRNAEPSPEPQPGEYTFEQFVMDVQVAEGQTGKWIDGIVGRKTYELTPTVSTKYNRHHAIVTPLERWLKQLGYYDGDIEEDLGLTPTFGNGMYEAVRAYQFDNDCVIDGVITARNKTWKELLKLA